MSSLMKAYNCVARYLQILNRLVSMWGLLKFRQFLPQYPNNIYSHKKSKQRVYFSNAVKMQKAKILWTNVYLEDGHDLEFSRR